MSASRFSLNIIQGKTYDLAHGTGLALWNALAERFAANAIMSPQASVAEGTVGRMFADPALVRRRLGQGAFRLLVTDVHTLFDRGYVTVTPDYRFRVSRRLENDWLGDATIVRSGERGTIERCSLPFGVTWSSGDPASLVPRSPLRLHSG